MTKKPAEKQVRMEAAEVTHSGTKRKFVIDMELSKFTFLKNLQIYLKI